MLSTGCEIGPAGVAPKNEKHVQEQPGVSRKSTWAGSDSHPSHMLRRCTCCCWCCSAADGETTIPPKMITDFTVAFFELIEFPTIFGFFF